MIGLAGKTAVVTGATRGIGRAIALDLAKNKVNVAFNYVSSQEAGDSLEKELQSCGVEAVGVRADLRDDQEVQKFITSVKAKFGQIDFLVNNAGILRDKSLMFMTAEDWGDVIDTNLSGVFRVTRLLIAGFLKQRHGSIVNISSTAGLMGSSGQVNYGSSKAGIIGFTKSLAREVAQHGIRVNAVAPGFIDTDMVKAIPAKKLDTFVKSIPMQRIGTCNDVAKMTTFLLSDDSGYITGHVFPVDGGLAI